MARKLKVKIDKNNKKNIDDLYEFYLNYLDGTTRRKLDKNILIKIYKGIEHYNSRKFRYLAFDLLVVSIAKIENYLKEDVAFSKEIDFEKYLGLSEQLAKDIAYDFNTDVLSRGVLEAMSINFFRWVMSKEVTVECITTDLTEDYPYKLSDVIEFTKNITCKSRELDIEFVDTEEMVLVTLENKEDRSYKYIELRKIDYVFMEEVAKLLKIMNLLLRSIDVLEEEVTFVERYKECIYKFQRITDCLYFKEILQVKYDKIPIDILKCLKTRNIA
ncbi:hypothetical protein [uncultured Cetobacterium sp.]|uniref:hypothetical protein n=1 Tax=uncultured Cetobacterium sp. TaxID=527638 RepID=UPI00260CAE30|nr:hypothetical protein [uncultured Cetobacterium sp.]